MEKNDTSSVLSKKISKLLETDIDHDKETLEALKGLSLFFNDNSLHNRRNLRSNIEKRSLAINEEFLNSFGEVKRVLDSLYADVMAMSDCCQQMSSRLECTRQQTMDLLNQTANLRNSCNSIRTKQKMVADFLDKYQLKPEEIAILQGSETNQLEAQIDARFFEVLKRVKKIHEESKLLLRNNEQTTGIEIMDSMAVHQEAAYERLYKWTLNVLRSFNSETCEVSSLLYQAIACMQERPVLFKYCLDEYGTVRRAAIVRNFIDALTRGGYAGSPAAIDMHANDPVRYVGDIMAWLHQAVASEKEVLLSLLKECDQEQLKQQDVVHQSLSFITEGLFRPTKVRIEQILICEPSSKKSYGPLVLYRVKNLLTFYQHIISEELLRESQLIYTLRELNSLSQRVFINSLNFHCSSRLGKTVAGDFEIPSGDLSPTDSFVRTIQLLQQILTCQDSSILSDDDRQEITLNVLNIVIEPLVKSCTISAARLPIIDMSVFLVNCINDLLSVISNIDYGSEYKEALSHQLGQHLETLINENTLYIINNLGLSALYQAVFHGDQSGTAPLSSLTGCDPLALQSFPKKLDTFLASPASMELQQLSLLKSDPLRENVRRSTTANFKTIYQKLHGQVFQEENKYSEPSNIFSYEPEQISAILS